ncbi:MAG: DUF4347 domain-containing protein [Leptolyngbya sp. DLM2.Bin15]|nr:MAG: DUF4347 domain-containing protein [Leptolyngbya sp. DLM2.Bin15]
MTNFRDDLTQSEAIASGLPTPAIASDRLELLVIDPSVQDYGQLIDGLRPGVVVYVLHPQQDGIEQITELLQPYNQQIQSLHLITHGDRGQLRLGHSLLTTSTLGRYGRSLQRWSMALAPHADILIYGCQVAAGVAGHGLIRQLQALTGANIAAATTPIGHASQGGTWDLDVKLGDVSTPVVVDAATQQAYAHRLELPGISISDLTVDEDVGDAVFTVTLSSPATEEVVVNFATNDFSATADEDYIPVFGQLTIPIGGTQGFITVTIIDDDIDEGQDGNPFEGEIFEVNLSVVSGADPASIDSNLTANGVIVDNDPAPVVNVLNTGLEVIEGAIARFTVVLDRPADGQITVNYTLNEGTATDGADYIFPVTPSLLFLARETQKVIEITIVDDDVYENNGVPETFSLQLLNATGNASGDGVELGPNRTSTVSIIDNDPVPVVNVNNLTVNEDVGTAVLAVTLSNPSDNISRITYATADGTAVSTGTAAEGTRDYIPRTGTLTFLAGVTASLITITIVDDVVEEADEQFFVNITGTSGPGNVDLVTGNTQAVVTIRDNDGLPVVTVLGDSQEEGADISFTVQLSRASTTPVVINYTTVNGTAIAETLTPELDGDNDYTFTQGSLTFEPGQTQLTVVVPTTADEIFEANETFTLQLSLDPDADNATFAGGSSVGTGTILNNDPAPVITVSEGLEVNEGALGNFPTAVVTFTLDRPSQIPITVNYETEDGTAESGGSIAAGTADYVPLNGILTFSAGSTIQRLTVTVNGDDTFEGSDETFVLNFSNPSSGATLTTTQSTVTILDNDAQPAIAILDTSVLEGNITETTQAVFTVQLTNPSQTPVTVTYSTEDGTASSGGDIAAGEGDFVAVSDAVLTFAPGVIEQLITITVNGDDINEGDETFSVNLSGANGATVADGVATGTIIDNDGPPAIAIFNTSVDEVNSGNTSSAIFTVQLSNASQTEITVTYNTADGTATSGGDANAGGADYVPVVDGVLVFAPGTTQQLITITVNGDDVAEEDETFSVVLSNPSGDATLDLDASEATGTIIDNDDPPGIAILDTAVTEGNVGQTTNAIFTVQLSNPSQTEVTVDYSTANITTSTGGDPATGGDDYVPVASATLTFAPGVTQQFITITVNGDNVNEDDETFSITLINPSGADLDRGLGIGTIIDNDAAPVVTISNATVLEGDVGETTTAVFTVSLSNPNQAAVTLAYATADGTAETGGDGALGGDDYVPVLDGALTFAPGVVQQFITITVNGDNVTEPEETFTVTLSGATGGATLGVDTGTGTIIDNDVPPVISVLNTSVLEGNIGETSDAIFTVRLSNPSQTEVTVAYNTEDGTASSGGDIAAGEGDYVPVLGGSLVFAPGTTQQLITITVNGDDVDEENETFRLILSAPTEATLGDGVATGTIIDNDGPPAIAILNTNVNEGNLGETTNAIFTVQLTNPSQAQVTVPYATADITTSTGGDVNAGGADYIPVLDGFLTFEAGETQQFITITVNGDDANEGDETFSVTLGEPTGGATLVEGADTAIGTIIDNDAQPAIAILGTSVLEGDVGTTSNAIFTVQLSNPSQTAIAVDYSTVDGTATSEAGQVGRDDYVPLDGSLTFAPGETRQLITVTVNGDAISEPNETFTVVLDNLQGTAEFANTTAVGTIIDDDAKPTVTINNVTVLEGDIGETSNAIFTVNLTTASQEQVTVAYRTEDGTASSGGDPLIGGADYVPVLDGSLTFAPGETRQLITITVNGDNVNEDTETFTIILSNPLGGDATLADTTATGTIIDNDDPPVLSISNTSVLEGDSGETTNAIFTVRLSNPSQEAIALTYNTQDNTATSTGEIDLGEADYVPLLDEVLNFAPGETLKLITVTVNGDNINEGDETFNLVLSDITGDVTFTNLVGVGTIVDNDAPPVVTINSVSVLEGDSGDTTNAVFTVRLDRANQTPVTVTYNTEDGTATAGGDSQVGGNDYVPVTNGVIVFEPGVLEQLITITVNGDDVNEPSETFNVVLSNPTGGAELSDTASVGTGTIIDDDAQPAIAILGTSVLEGDVGTTSNAIFTVQLSNPSQTAIAVDYSTVDGTATSEAGQVGRDDYVPLDGSLTFAPGETRQLITVTVNGDAISEPNETFTVVLDNLQGTAEFANTTAVGTIIDDDAKPTVTINNVTVLEGDIGETSNAIFTVNLTTASQEQVTVAYRTEDGTASSGGDPLIGGADYVPVLDGSLTFAPGETRQLITITVNGDNVNEDTETFTIILSNPLGGDATLADTTATGTIIDNDDPPVLSISNTSVLEGDSGETTNAIFTVRLSNPSQEAIAVTYNTANITTNTGGDPALGENDYIPVVDGVLNFAAGETLKLITITVNGDDISEGTETFSVNLSGVTGDAIPGNVQGIGTIVDNDPLPQITILDTAVQEGNLGETAIATHTVLLSAPSAQTVTVGFATANGTATVANNDYLATFGQITFAPGQTVATINVTVVGDDTFEPDETYVINLSNPSNASLGNTQGIGTIENDDPQPVISILGVTVNEGDAGTTLAPFTVQLSNPSFAPVIVAYETVDGTATAAPGVGGNDYVAASGLVTFAAGQTTQVVNITVNGDTTFEGGGIETFEVRLSSPTGGVLSSSARQAIGGIQDDDDLPVVMINDASVLEGDTGTSDLIFTVSLSAVNAATAQVAYQVNDGTATAADNDYIPDAGTLVFAPGQTVQTLTVQVVGDIAFEDDETLTVELSNFDGMAAGDAIVGTGTILNDDEPATYNFLRAAFSAREGDTTNTVNQVRVVRSGDTTLASTVTVLLAAGTPPATPGVDFTPGPVTVTFAPGETIAPVPIEILGDTDFEPDEVINLSFGTVTPGNNGRIGTTQPTATFTILNDDPEPQIYEFNRTTYSAREPRSDRRTVETVQVIRSGDITVNSRVDVRLTGISATAGDDFVAGPVRVRFSPGETIQSVPITILADDLVEDDEEVRLSFTNFNRNGMAGDQNTATFVILDNPPPVEPPPPPPPPGRVPVYNFTSRQYRVLEGDRRRRISEVEIRRTGNINIGSSVWVEVRGVGRNPATPGEDLSAGPIRVRFKPGERVKQVPIVIFGDRDFEPNERARLTMTDFNKGGRAGQNRRATLVILNDDPRPLFSPRCAPGDRLVGDNQDNVLRGGRGSDILIGRGGNDRLFGGACDDLLIGGPGDDVLNGGRGNDVLIGGPGNDILIGGKGRNTFVFEDVHHGVDIIRDFKPGKDLIDFRELGIRYRDISIGPSIGLGLNRSTVISVNGHNLVVLRDIEQRDVDVRRDFLV